jgi:pyruvate,water dikinase
MGNYVVNLKDVGMRDVGRVGGKNASLGDLINHLSEMGVDVPGGFATTADAYRDFLSHAGLTQRITAALDELDVDDVAALARAGEKIRAWIMDSKLPCELHDAIVKGYTELEAETGGSSVSVAVRSSATAEDLPDASFAGQQETYLNVSGLHNVLHSVKRVFASLFNDRAIAYRVHHGFNHADVALSAGVQRMARSDIGSAGMMFTLDTETGFRDVVLITGSYGLGEAVVQGCPLISATADAARRSTRIQKNSELQKGGSQYIFPVFR